MQVKASVRYPDEDLKVEEFPMITIYGMFDTENIYRRKHSRFIPYVVYKDLETATLSNQPQPIDIFYQIDFWSLSNRQINEMTAKWLGMCLRFFNINYKDVSIYCSQNSNMRNNVQFDQARKIRVFNSNIDYRIWATLFDENTYKVPLVQERIFNFK